VPAVTTRMARRDRPSLREAFSAAAVAAALGAILAGTAAPVAAAPASPPAIPDDSFRAVSNNGPAWIVSPRAARPGEVVHVRIKYTSPPVVVGKPSSTPPQVIFAFQNDLRRPVQGRVYAAEGTFGADLVVPPGTDWGADPIVWAAGTVASALATPSRFVAVFARNAPIPFVASRSAQPPLWNR
jgi:hypothetical protein